MPTAIHKKLNDPENQSRLGSGANCCFESFGERLRPEWLWEICRAAYLASRAERATARYRLWRETYERLKRLYPRIVSDAIKF